MIFAVLALSLHARESDTDEGPRVLVRTSPSSPLSGSVWTLTLLIEHPVPEEVDVLAPSFAGDLFPDRVFRGGRVLNAEGEDAAGDSGTRWTVAEYRFIPEIPGTRVIGSFTVTSPRGKTLTPPLSLNVRDAKSLPSPYRPEIFWDTPPLGAGEEAVLQLRVRQGDSLSPAREIPRPGDLPGAALLMPPVPEGLILEAAPLDEAARGEGILLRLKVIPLNVSVLSLPARTVAWGDAVFEIPALRVPVAAASSPEPALKAAPSAAGSAAAESEAAAEREGTASQAAAAAFPSFRPPRIPLPKSLAASCEMLYAMADNLWDRGYRAEALAGLRRNERDHPAGPLFAALRREAERSLALTGAPDEKWRPGKLVSCLACLALAAALFFRAVFGGRKRRLVFAAFFLFAGLIFMYGFFETAMPWKTRRAVARETAVRGAPDAAAAVTARFAEGLVVRIGPGGAAAGGAKDRAWVWAEDFREEAAGPEGWVSVESLVFY
ncbi:MAG: hypothetical protein LBP27_05635 [Treponema sp.]|jgi:hypothetical protein|nr:hypothetical protein [Treponema sp.]